ncbi:MAG: hypothetical protein IKB14_04910 [Rikenellaceae bacterium]|nr:hypothetical protein [Rikenellaceae bacterium]MBR2420039.1 hypothetical protein [Rikenellaceae bacterium]MBR3801021.1 hypothetical protein [Rikenellaceae bacterium]
MKTTTKLLLAILFATLAVGQATAADQNKKEQKQSKKELRFLLDTVGRSTMTIEDGQVIYAPYFKNKDKHPIVDYRAWAQYMVRYPKGCSAKGQVKLQYIVEKDGSVSFKEVIFSADPALTEAVKDVLDHSPRWHPAVSLDGKEFYRVTFTLNVMFNY